MTDSTTILLFGGIIIDQYVLVDQSPPRGGDALIHDSFFRVGGCAINVGTTLQNLGIRPWIVSAVGDDAWGLRIRAYLEEKQFPAEAIRYGEKQASGYCLSIVEQDGERTFLTYKGCEAVFMPSMLEGADFRQISHVYVTGYYLLDPAYTDAIAGELKKLKAAGAYLVFDPGPLAASIPTETLLTVLKLTDLLLPNDAEWTILGELLNGGTAGEPPWRELGIGTVILKQGSRGADVRTADGGYRVAPYSAESIDTSGAGDSFAGGLLYSLARGDDMRTAVQIAAACGALTTTLMGPHGAFSLNDIMNLIQKAR
ncbi:carbohydrate kinase family protein [Paenibacillus sp. R14(2021)]|uniref:carbohydrate kinase family protein n=1 Tax=Paenibacillus sp. R14(2021) TaxID=2859228 RepID=UPI001C615A8A|nr:carbohydrate kinase family protein [Paenibacillus sp. R14(2021)]